MKILNYSKEDLIKELTKRIKEISMRERIVLTFPFNCDINRIEFYCSETIINGSPYSGVKFPGIFSIQVFCDYTNKASQKSSYSYEKEFLSYLPKLIDKCYLHIN